MTKPRRKDRRTGKADRRKTTPKMYIPLGPNDGLYDDIVIAEFPPMTTGEKWVLRIMVVMVIGVICWLALG